MPGSSIIICGQFFDIGQRVVTFAEDPTINAYTPRRTDRPGEIFPYAPAKGMGTVPWRWRPRRLIGGDRSLNRLRQVIRQFVVHHDGCQDSRMCFQVLHNERGLSVHFLIDNDGTVFQTLDLVDCAFQAAGVNEISIGVELANRGDAHKFPNEYRGARDKLTINIHGHQFLAYGYTRAQMESMISLGKALQRIFPNLPQTYPAAPSGDPWWSFLPDPRAYAGYLGHFHVTPQKWDPGPFDFKYFASKIRARSVFPLVISGDSPELPEDPAEVAERAEAFFENNETEGEGGYFPVGPMGQSRLWHGGIHSRAEKGTPLFAPFGGRALVARMTDECAIGSRSFVLLRHELTVGAQPLRFWTLYFHLDDEAAYPEPAQWFARTRAQLGEDAAAIDIEVAAGELIGHVGEAGAPGRFEGQVHLEVMTAEEIGARLEPGFWKIVDGSGSGRFCSALEILQKIDKPTGGRRDGVLSRAEVLSFFRQDPEREELRRLAVRHLSEWSIDDAWEVAIGKAPDFADLAPPQRHRLFQDQIQPVLWWSDELGEAAGLPEDKVIWSYHPIQFIVWLQGRLRGATTAGAGIGDAAAFRGQAAPVEIKDDADATEGFTDDEDLLFGDQGKKLKLEDLANGYGDKD